MIEGVKRHNAHWDALPLPFTPTAISTRPCQLLRSDPSLHREDNIDSPTLIISLPIGMNFTRYCCLVNPVAPGLRRLRKSWRIPGMFWIG